MKKVELALVLLIVGLAFFYRIYGLQVNHPFWGDEIFTASQANVLLRNGLSIFSNHKLFLEHHNITEHVLVSVMFALFGQHEYISRIPSALFGSFVVLAVFVVSRKFFNKSAAFSGSLLTGFSYLMI